MLDVSIGSFRYPNTEKHVLTDIAFQLKEGEHLAVLGESGGGKSTLLHVLYGLFDLKDGAIYFNNNPLFGPSHNLIPGHSFMKLVSQEFNLMPYTTVAENIADPLTRLDREKDNARVDELLQVVGLEHFRNRKVRTLSGGQKQRVALAKALAQLPKVLLLDEPFSSIDTFKKNGLRRTLFSYLKTHRIACIAATHDSEEALAFADKLMLLKEGKGCNYGSPEDIFSKAATPFEAGFFGEVTVLPKHVFLTSEKSTKTVFLAHELTLSKEKTAVGIVVKNSYFKGRNYLIHCHWNQQEVFFEHHEALAKGSFHYIRPS